MECNCRANGFDGHSQHCEDIKLAQTKRSADIKLAQIKRMIDAILPDRHTFVTQTIKDILEND